MERLLPTNIEAECGVLGSLLIDPEAVSLVADWLHPEDFYRDAHRTIYEAILTLYERNQPADFITLCELLEQLDQLDSVGDASYLTSLIHGVPTSSNIEYYAHIVVQKAGFRRLIHAAGQIAAFGYEEAEDAQERAEQLLFALQRRSTRDFVSLAEVLSDCMNDLEALQKGVGEGNFGQQHQRLPAGAQRVGHRLEKQDRKSVV